MSIDEIATQFGIELADDRANELEAEAEAFRETLDVFEPADPDNELAKGITTGADEYDAFRYQFEYESGDGPLHDLEVAVKDNIAVAGVPMHCGSRSIEFTPPYNATATAKLLDDGATIVGTTNMDKLAYFTTGETCDFGAAVNPEAEGCVAGGSSSGSGAAVAAGLVDAALGTDTGGSVRIPASFCGTVGFKPTYRSVSRFGFVDLAPSFDHIGTLADSVETAARVVDSMTGVDVNDPSTYARSSGPSVADGVGKSVSELNVGLVAEAFDLSTAPVAETVRNAAEKLSEHGCTVDSVSVPGYSEIIYALTTIESCEFATLLLNNGHVYGAGTGYSEGWRRVVSEFVSSGDYGEHLAKSLVINAQLLNATEGKQYVAAQNARRDFVRTIRSLFETYDALITPTTPTPAPELGDVDTIDDLLETEANTGPFNLTGHPAISIPAGRVGGRPIGLQVVAGWNDDPIAARIGSAIERISTP
ncbi:amidase [Natrarchaeobius oligotrophus]|uniref:Amidase domain-containing protein n=1 Tax=Natrarchaeobius chitinivorans TaxID=1679083 RepID=A0A3N6MVL3_NATCH|nr:amidase family protein [Natrarchaeobius chitinivorans]RQG98956.1 hypothetical protein EA472_15525 [Natrarchaeobius chitinivorans]